MLASGQSDDDPLQRSWARFEVRLPRLLSLLPGGAALTAVLGLGASARAEVPPPVAPSALVVIESPPERYQPLLSHDLGSLRLEAPILVAGRGEGVSGFPVDRDHNLFQSGLALSPLLRIGLRLDTIKPLGGKFLVFAEYEHDLPTGTWTSQTPLAGAELPNSTPIATSLRKGWGRVSVGPYLHIGGGFMTSHWGLGLVANDGAHRWEPGSARFTDPRGGDLVLRGFVSTGPLTAAHLTAAFAVEKVRSDAVLLPDDSAHQLIASVLIGQDQGAQAGYFLVHRHQAAPDGSVLDVNVIDVAGRVAMPLQKAKLTLEAEGAIVAGTTTLGASVEVPRSDVLQLGGALRASLAFDRVGGVLDLLFASGDSNTHDARVNGFHANPNFETGLLLFRYVQAAQTGRGFATATDPQLVGAPPAGAERLPTRGGLTNAFVVFPRVWARPARGLETYGGVLFAVSPARNIDPFNTDIVGGSPRNALGAEPGSYLATELDLGLRYRVYLRGTELTAGAEGGLLLPGSALAGLPGQNFGPVYGGRFMLTYRL
jgi:hypothetical protein